MVVVPESYDPKKHRRSYDGYMALWGLGFAKELMVLTEQEFQERSTNKNYLAFRVKNEGVCIYSQP